MRQPFRQHAPATARRERLASDPPLPNLADPIPSLSARGVRLQTDSWTIHGLWPDNCDGTYNSVGPFQAPPFTPHPPDTV